MTNNLPAAAIVAIAAELRDLSDLRDWRPVSDITDVFLSAVTGGEGLRQSDVVRFRAVRARWLAMRADLREFYAAHAHSDEFVSIALWGLLFTHPTRRLDPAHRGRLLRLWEEWAGQPPAIEIYPRSK